MDPWLTIVVVAYDMHRELPRTLRSLSSAYQRDLPSENYRIVVLDNGSSPALDPAEIARFGPQFELEIVGDPAPSPVAEVNRVVRSASSELVGVIFDGARMVSPGALSALARAVRLAPRPLATLLAWHLGPDHQSRSVPKGYGVQQEDDLLTSISWPDDGYDLFTIASLESSNPAGWFGPLAESTCLLTTAEVWRDLGGFDERFRSPGSGLANHHLLNVVAARGDVTVVVALGEGTFHQVHGGITTSGAENHWADFAREYEEITGKPYELPAIQPLYVGAVGPQAMRWIGAATEVDDLSRGNQALRSHADALSAQLTELTAELRRRAAADGPAGPGGIPWMGRADLVATTGFHGDRWVAPSSTLRLTPLVAASELVIDGWVPSDIDGSRTITVTGPAGVTTAAPEPGLFELRIAAPLEQGRPADLALSCDWAIGDAIRPAEDQRSLAWRLLGARIE